MRQKRTKQRVAELKLATNNFIFTYVVVNHKNIMFIIYTTLFWWQIEANELKLFLTTYNPGKHLQVISFMYFCVFLLENQNIVSV